jgi:aminoglycoside phosphotransferase (APT) family kinase protein
MPLDIERANDLIAYLRQSGRIGVAESPRIAVLAGGISNRTVLVEHASGEAWVMKQALPKLRVAVDWFSDPARIEREALALRVLPELAPPGAITPLIFEDPANHLLAMAAVPSPYENWKSMLLAGRVEADHVRQFAQILAAIHRGSWLRRDELAPMFADRQFFESLRLEPYFAYAAEQVPEAAAFLSQLIADTRARRLALVHGDYSPKNILVRNDRLVLLDHEVIHFGDPAFDLGFALTHFLSKAHHLTAHRSRFINAANDFWRIYRSEIDDVPWAADLESHVMRQTLGCLLARVAGRSPLEYLDAAERTRQRVAVVELMQKPPGTINELADRFIAAIDRPLSLVPGGEG